MEDKTTELSENRNEVYNAYGVGVDPDNDASVLSNQVGNSWFGRIWNDLTGKTAQSREFAQQEYMQEKQWAYDAPAAEMARMKAAGINPHTAAAGIAGGNVSASAPAVPTGSMDVAGGIGKVAAAAGGLLDSGVGAFSTLSKLGPEIKNIESGTNLNESLAFLNDTEREGLEIDQKYKDAKNIAELNWRSQQLKNMKKDWDMIDKQSAYLQKQLDIFDEQIAAEIDLTKKRALEAEKHAFEMEQRGNLEKQEFDFHEKYAYSRFSNADSVAFNLFKKGYDSGDFSEFEEFNKKYGEWLQDRSYNEEIGRQSAITEEQFNQSWNDALARSSFADRSEEFSQMLDLYKEFFMESFKIANRQSSGSRDLLTNLLDKFFNEVSKLVHTLGWKVNYPTKTNQGFEPRPSSRGSH